MQQSQVDESFTEARSFHAQMTSAGSIHRIARGEHVIEGGAGLESVYSSNNMKYLLFPKIGLLLCILPYLGKDL